MVGFPATATPSLNKKELPMLEDRFATILSSHVVTPEEVRQVLRLGKNAIYKSIKSGEIPATRFGNNFRITGSWLRGVVGFSQTAA